MVGTGLTMEAIEQNPVVYELMAEMGWRNEKFDVEQWLHEYARRRYGADSPLARTAWSQLHASVYKSGWSWTIKSIVERAPALLLYEDQSSNTTGLVQAWRTLYAALIQKQVRQIGPYLYDLVDVSRQCLVNLFNDFHLLVVAEYSRFTAVGVNTTAELVSLNKTMVGIINDLERLLASDANYLLGHWIADSLKTAQPLNSTQQKNRQFNARNQLTMWGPDANIDDYASKSWSGLMSNYYKPRWGLFMGMLTDAVRSGQQLNNNVYSAKLLQLERAWSAATEPKFRDFTVGASAQIAGELLSKYANCQSCNTYQNYTDMDVHGKDINVATAVWTRDIQQLKFLCDADPSCVGFNTNGWLKSATSPMSRSVGIDLYLKKVLKPSLVRRLLLKMLDS